LVQSGDSFEAQCGDVLRRLGVRQPFQVAAQEERKTSAESHLGIIGSLIVVTAMLITFVLV